MFALCFSITFSFETWSFWFSEPSPGVTELLIDDSSMFDEGDVFLLKMIIIFIINQHDTNKTNPRYFISLSNIFH